MSNVVSASRFRRYVRELSGLNHDAAVAGALPLSHVDRARAHLDGRAGHELRRAVPLADLRRLGAFFTGEALAQQMISRLGEPSTWRRIVDPACGCGDLLLAAASRLPVADDLETTLATWGKVLAGVDIVPEFVDVARQRLMLLALHRGAQVASGHVPNLPRLLPHIVVGNGLRPDVVRDSTAILMNPPYGRIPAPSDIAWTSGLVTAAAIWVARVIEATASGTQVIAVLPDVLRSGSRFAKWRDLIADNATIDETLVLGQFDALTDVDVFLFVATRADGQSSRGWPTSSPSGPTLADHCDVMVGSVVDRRDPHDGPLVPYITTRELPPGGEYVPHRRRRFSKRLFSPPFVVVRRTSRPTSQTPRLRPVVIRGDEPVAVENHLIVLQPHHRSLESCRRLAELLSRSAVSDWLNLRIRTRHLTVGAVRGIPVLLLEGRMAAEPTP